MALKDFFDAGLPQTFSFFFFFKKQYLQSVIEQSAATSIKFGFLILGFKISEVKQL